MAGADVESSTFKMSAANRFAALAEVFLLLCENLTQQHIPRRIVDQATEEASHFEETLHHTCVVARC